MNIFLIPIGSAGDVNPFIGLGAELARRGHRCTLLANDHFKEISEAAGLEFIASSRLADYDWMLEDPRLWDPLQGFEFVARNAFLPIVPFVYEFLKERYVPGETLVVGSTSAWGARLAQEKLGVPFVTVHLQPSVFVSAHDTPVYSGAGWVSDLPRPLKKIVLKFVGATVDGIVTPELNRFRASLQLGPVRGVMEDWWHSPLCTLGLFPEWFAPPQPDWPASVRLTNFPLYDGGQVQGVPPEVEAFLSHGPAPVVFTAGSAMKQAQAMFAVSLEVCKRIGCRGLLINLFPDQIPAQLPDGVMACRWAPFSGVFARAAAVVHHGGIGTTAQALAAGVPQLVTPFAHDQFDNAMRVLRLGVGERIFPKAYRPAAVEAALKRLMQDNALRERARSLSVRLNGPQAIARTCDLILGAVNSTSRTWTDK